MLEVIEPAIESLSEVDEEQTLAELDERGWTHDPAEVDLAHQDIREKREHVLPRVHARAIRGLPLGPLRVRSPGRRAADAR
jgi:hypothetical protein